MKRSYTALSHTRGVPLTNLAGLCYILGTLGNPTSVKNLVLAALDKGMLTAAEPLQPGGRLPTRINHHMIALRDLNLVTSDTHGGSVYYGLTLAGSSIAVVTAQTYPGSGVVEWGHALRTAWRPVFVDSPYVRYHWLKYFMPAETHNFTYDELIASGTLITIYKVPSEERLDTEDSGYRIISAAEHEHTLDEFARREIHQGLRRWTNDSYLTDDRVPDDIEEPFSYLMNAEVSGHLEIDSHIVKSWLDPVRDLDYFEQLVNEVLADRGQGGHITIPELVIALSQSHNYSKENVKALLIELYYERGRHYFFERGSEFLLHHALPIRHPQDYYVQVEGIWRTGLVKY